VQAVRIEPVLALDIGFSNLSSNPVIQGQKNTLGHDDPPALQVPAKKRLLGVNNGPGNLINNGSNSVLNSVM
jgi:hypothetical protein